MNTIHIYKSNIDKFISSYSEDLKKYYIYGSITKQELNERQQQHINDKQPLECNENWEIVKITTLKIKDNNKLEEYKNLITDIENYLITKLGKINNKCVNSRDRFGNLEQT
jgi:hypothetical protein